MNRIFYLINFSILLAACGGQVESENSEITSYTPTETPYDLDLPAHFESMPVPEDNPLSQEKVLLGERLFNDPILSRDTSVSCSSCHDLLTLTDNLIKSIGIEGRTAMRNAPSLFNVGYEKTLFRDGGSPNLEIQVLTPIQDENEMDLKISEVLDRLNTNEEYIKLFREAFGCDKITSLELGQAIASFERTLISAGSPWDLHQNGNDKYWNEKAEKGWQLFSSDRLKCTECHSGFNFTNGSVQNNGLYAEYEDPGRYRVTHDSADLAMFKVPSLRNVAFTGPYMHDGSIETLEEIVDHYAAGGKHHPHQSELITGFNLSQEERLNLLSFLYSLTDTSITNSINQTLKEPVLTAN